MYTVDESFLKEEDREGFLVPEMMKRAWATYLKIYCEIRNLCEKYNLKHYAAFGTALGAIRHKGFIPWDDDFDIAMPRADYMEFLSHADEMPAPYRVKSIYTQHDFSQFHAVVSNSRATKLSWDEDRIHDFFGCPYIVGIDIYPYDNLTEDLNQRKLQELIYYLGYSLSYDYVEKSDTEEYKKKLKIFNEKLGASFKVENPDYIKDIRLATDRIAMFGLNKSHSHVAYFPHLVTSVTTYPILDKSWFENIMEVPFENIKVPLPEGIHHILKVVYGENYMIPMNNGAAHGYPFYASQEEYFQFCRENGIK